MQSGTQSKFILTLDPKRLAIIFSLLILILTHAHVAGQFAHFFFGVDDSKLVDAFNLDYERSIPTFFVVVEWLFCLVLLGFIAYYRKMEHMQYAHWLGMVILFFFLTMDEFLAIHESFSKPIRLALNTSGLFYFAWVLLYAGLLIILLFVYLKFMISLPVKTRNLFICAFLVFILGALGMELLTGGYLMSHARNKAYYIVFVTNEEFLEMTGLMIFIYSLSSYITEELGVSQIQLLPFKFGSSSE
jgi:hypothetical protein